MLVMTGLFIPSASLTLHPEAKTQSIVIPIAASEATDAVSVTGAVPARKISVVVEREQSLAITSQISIPKSKAAGIARFTNLGQDEVEIPEGTFVATETAQRFVTLNDTRLPAGTDKFVDVKIEALEAGAQGNVQADKIIIVEGTLGLSISVTNPNPLKGGSNAQVTGATDDDRARLRESLLENLRRDAETKLRAQIASTDLLLMDTLDVAKIDEETFTPAAGEAGKDLTLKMKAEFSARYVADADLRQLSLSTLGSAVDAGFEAQAAPAYKVITDPSTDNSGISHFEVEVTRLLIRQVDEMRVFSLVRGQNPGSVKDKLSSQLSLRQPPQISITPSWWPWLPLIPFNFSMEVK